MFRTVNKPLVPEWPCIIEVSDISSSYNISNYLQNMYLKLMTSGNFNNVYYLIEWERSAKNKINCVVGHIKDQHETLLQENKYY